MTTKVTDESLKELKLLKRAADEETSTVSFRVQTKMKNRFQALKSAANLRGLTFDFQEIMVSAYTRTVNTLEKELQVIGMTKEEIEIHIRKYEQEFSKPPYTEDELKKLAKDFEDLTGEKTTFPEEE